jgi:hypothetical protein
MKKWTPIVLCFGLVFGGSVTKLMAEKGRGQNSKPTQGTRLTGTGQTHGNAQGSLDRDLGNERAKEVGKGNKKGLYKDQYSIGEGKEKHGETRTNDKTDKAEKGKKHDEKEKGKDKQRNKDKA